MIEVNNRGLLERVHNRRHSVCSHLILVTSDATSREKMCGEEQRRREESGGGGDGAGGVSKVTILPPYTDRVPTRTGATLIMIFNPASTGTASIVRPAREQVRIVTRRCRSSPTFPSFFGVGRR